MFVATCGARLLAVLLAIQAPQYEAPLLTLPERAALARPLLLHAEAVVPADDLATRALLLYRAAGAWLDLDRTHAVELDRQAFAAARLIESKSLRKDVERDILYDLLPLSPSAFLDLPSHPHPEPQDPLSRPATNFSLPQAACPDPTTPFDRR